MSKQNLEQLLVDAGFDSGWALTGGNLILWEHNEDPPEPLTRPKDTDETPTAD
jgi:hypothetical protein